MMGGKNGRWKKEDGKTGRAGRARPEVAGL
jgi:hypothetical protein